MATTRKQPVPRFLEFLRIRTVSGEGPNGSYNQVRPLAALCLSFYAGEQVLTDGYSHSTVRGLVACVPRRRFVLQYCCDGQTMC